MHDHAAGRRPISKFPEDDHIVAESPTQPPLPDEELPVEASCHDEAILFNPPLPDEEVPIDPPLPEEEVPTSLATNVAHCEPPLPEGEDLPVDSEGLTHENDDDNENDGWQAIYDPNFKAFYFYNTITKTTTWDNPRAKQAEGATSNSKNGQLQETSFAFQAQFSRRTGRFIADPTKTADQQTVDAREDRQLSRFFDISTLDAGGMSLRGERAEQTYSKQQMKLFKKNYKERKEAKRRAWLLTDEEEHKRKYRF